MKGSRFSDAQKAFILKRAEEGVPIGNVCLMVPRFRGHLRQAREGEKGVSMTKTRREFLMSPSRRRLCSWRGAIVGKVCPLIS